MGQPITASRSAVRPRGTFGLIAVAASAGGLAALKKMLGALPATLDVPIVVVQHRSTHRPLLLPEILQRVSPFQVKQAEHGDLLSPGFVYVAPPDFHVLVLPDHTLQLMDGRRIKHLLSSANPLFESAARVLKHRFIAVVLTGSGSDATDGVQAVKRMGGVVIAQDPQQAEFPAMPQAAIRTGAVDYILPIEEIPPVLLRLTNGRRKRTSTTV